ncbi:MAG: tRNA (adenosine(37)-N6)-dimethylallyltransferase MiaA [Candidatus Pacebacteria bacterium]|nr:tRNA (adenosine(37)-N6)-dimethylallyltransferase MiaA [Candidatus Paceibacterota bacterium]
MGIKRNKDKLKVVVVLGPTSSGKSDLAVEISKKFNGEVISADSRQVYKKMDIGSGKVTEEEMQGVPHYLLDVVDPKKRFSVSDYKKLAEKAVKQIAEKGKLPIVCGGTAFYIKALMDGVVFPKVSPDWTLRRRLEKKTTEELYQELEKKDPQRAENIDSKNKVRLIRALEIISKTKKPVPKVKEEPPYNSLYIGIDVDQEELEERIEKRLDRRIEEGMIEEVRSLKEDGVSWERLEELGLEYRWIARYLQGKIDYEEAKERLSTDIKKFSKRQRTWWRGDERIHWIKNLKEAEDLVNSFIK